MKVLVLGDGLLGSEIVRQTGWDYISRKKAGFDITDTNTWKGLYQYDHIVNCIAHTDTYSNDRQKHWDVNYVGVDNLLSYCAYGGTKLIHISTDYVLTNTEYRITENEVPIHGPNWYSYTKLLAEGLIQLRMKEYEYLICRGTHKPKPFPYDIAWEDQYGNFDYVDVIADKIIRLINTDAYGLYNVGTESKTMYELAKQTNPNVIKNKRPSYVPEDTGMNVDKLNNWLKEHE